MFQTTKTIPYGRQHITEEDIQAVTEALQADFLTQGPRINAFEEAFAEYVGSKYAVALSNGTAALHLCAMALGVDENTNVITTPITFAATANCVKYCGGTVTFADIDPDTALLDINKVRTLLESAPKGTYQGIIPVDFGGYPIDMEAFRKLADEYGCWIIEDACHAPGGYFIDSNGNQQFCGNSKFADMAIFSFHPVKHIACGEGGMITTDSKELYDKLLILRTHGITKDPDLLEENHGGWYYEMQELGYNYRITDIQAALGSSQLSRADEGLARRREIASTYDKAFAGTLVKTIIPHSGAGHAYHLYVIQVENRKELYDTLRDAGIFAQIHYIPVHTLPYYQRLGYKKGTMPMAEKYYEHCLSLPMYPTLSDEEQLYVIEKYCQTFDESTKYPTSQVGNIPYRAEENMRKVFFRVDGNSIIGLGHVSRCMALAESLSQSYHRIAITHISTSVLDIMEKGFDKVIVLPNEVSPDEEADFIAQTYLVAKDILVLDGYKFTTQYQTKIKKRGCTLVCIDDIHTCHFVADVVINHSDGATDDDYSTEPYTRFFGGMKYAMLRRPFIRAISQKKVFSPEVEMVICMGGSGSGGLNEKMLDVVSRVTGVDTIHMIIGKATPDYEKWEKNSGDSKLKICRNLSAEEMVALISRSHLVVCPASTISIEVVAVKSGLVTGWSVNNQLSILKGLKKAKVCWDVGNFVQASSQQITETIQEVLKKGEIDRMIENQEKIFEINPELLHKEIFRSL